MLLAQFTLYAGMYGVLKNFVTFLLSDYTGSEPPSHVVSKRSRRVLRDRGTKLRLTAEFGRPYKCIVDSLKSYQLVDWLHFLETFSWIILRNDILDVLMQSMWDKLRYMLMQCVT